MSGRHIPDVQPSDVQIPAGSMWARLPTIGLALAALGGLASMLLAFMDSQRFFYSFHTLKLSEKKYIIVQKKMISILPIAMVLYA